MTNVRVRLLILGVLTAFAGLVATPAAAQRDRAVVDSLQGQVHALQLQVRDLEIARGRLDDRMDRLGSGDEAFDSGGGLALFAVAVFCALWAQNTGRNAWLWFFLGLFFHAITLVFLLVKNANDRRAGTMAEAAVA